MRKLSYPQLVSTYILTFLFSINFLTACNTSEESTTGGDTPEKRKIILRTVLRELSNYHYSPVQIDDIYSEKVFNQFIDVIDGNKLFLLKKDVERLEEYKLTIDEEFHSGTTNFFDISIDVIQKRIAETDEFYKEILAEPFDFKSKNLYQSDPEKRDYADSKKDQRLAWKNWIKYRLLNRVQAALIEEEENETSKSFKEIEKEARKKELKFHNEWFKRMNQITPKDRFANYVNVLTSIYDPHTGYFPPEDKENFDISISGRLEGIGARLQEEDGYVKVQAIIPGSASWREGSLEENDLITAVAQDGSEAVSVVDMKLSEVVKLIRGPKGTKVHLTVKKVDGSFDDIAITRDVVILEEGYAKSVILNNSSNEKIGFIKLPKFYTDFTNSGGRTCSRDVKNEIEALKKKNVSGIILDLRDNGGGSLRDVVDMAGLFIEKGPIVQVKHQVEEALILEDQNPEVSYDGPLIIMINNFSASASEIMAAAMQDYDRALIVGSTSFGKGTVQRFINLDRTVFSNNDLKPLGSLKLTIQKFYRVDGSTNQLRGVEPDIFLPDIYSKIDIGEKENKNALSWSETKPVAFEQNVYELDDISKIKLGSAYRIDTTKAFDIINQRAQLLKDQRDKTEFSLNLKDFQASTKAVDDNGDLLSEVLKTERDIKVRSPYDTEETDEAKKERQENWFSEIKKDIYIDECLHIMHDLIQTKTSSNSQK